MGQKAGTGGGVRPVQDLRTMLRGHGRLPPAQAALFVADIADQLAIRHARGLTLALETVAVELRGQRPRPVLNAPGRPRPEATPATDVYALGLLLAEVLGADVAGGQGVVRPAAVPDALWLVVRDCLTTEPTAAHVATRLRGCARDLLLGRQPAPRQPDTPRPGVPVPDYVPGPPPVEPVARQRKRRGRVLVVVSTAASVVLAAVGITFAVTQDDPPRAQQKAAHTPAATSTTTTTPTTTTTTPAPTGTTAPPANTGPATPPPASPTQQPPVTVTETTEAAPPPPPPPPEPGESSPPQPPTSVCTPGDCAARATFAAYGEHLYVCDNKPDGHAAVAWYRRSDVPGQNNEAWARDGSGTCLDQNMNMPEGTTITFKVCTGDYRTRKYLVCSKTITNTG